MKKAATFVLTSYKRWISPALPASCRFVPSCSEYALEAVERHGVLVGGWLTLLRFLRCQPLCKPGFDPVPDGLFNRHPHMCKR